MLEEFAHFGLVSDLVDSDSVHTLRVHHRSEHDSDPLRRLLCSVRDVSLQDRALFWRHVQMKRWPWILRLDEEVHAPRLPFLPEMRGSRHVASGCPATARKRILKIMAHSLPYDETD